MIDNYKLIVLLLGITKAISTLWTEMRSLLKTLYKGNNIPYKGITDDTLKSLTIQRSIKTSTNSTNRRKTGKNITPHR